MGCVKEEIKWAHINFTFENLDGQDEVRSDKSAFFCKLEYVELAKPFHI